MPSVNSLNVSALSAIAAGSRPVRVPTYDRTQLTRAIAHIGVGGFHRAHQAVYLDDLARYTTAWGECGIGLLDQDRRMADAMRPQDGLYTVVERDARADTARIVGSMVDYLYAPDDPEDVLCALADAATRLVSLTVTEDGYNVDGHTGKFDDSNLAVLRDLEHPSTPTTVFGYLCEALDRRRTAGLAPFTILSCDNLEGNGDVTRMAVVSFARLRSDALGSWIASHVAFPNSVVDRITPQTTDAHREMVRGEFGIEDRWPVVTEPFRQWIIEDEFSNGRPPLEAVQDGTVWFVQDARPYETLKLRLLNASHSAMGYLGYLAGYRQIHEVMEDHVFKEFIRRLMDDEVTPLLPPVPGIDVDDYKRSLLERFANPKIGDQLARICLNGSAKVPKFLLPSIAEALSSGLPYRLLALAVAGWMRYLQGADDHGTAITVEDPQAAALTTLARKGGTDPRPLLGMRSIFGELGQVPVFVQAVEEALRDLHQLGARDTLYLYLSIADI
jgi:mannitol 2-dehydrogenase